MDELLKKRLLGAALLTGLVTIFGPLLMKDKDAPSPKDVPAPIKGVVTQPMPLPLSPSAEAEKKQTDAALPSKAIPKSGYQIIPLNEPPPSPPPAPVLPPKTEPDKEGTIGNTTTIDGTFPPDEGEGKPFQTKPSKPVSTHSVEPVKPESITPKVPAKQEIHRTEPEKSNMEKKSDTPLAPTSRSIHPRAPDSSHTEKKPHTEKVPAPPHKPTSVLPSIDKSSASTTKQVEKHKPISTQHIPSEKAVKPAGIHSLHPVEKQEPDKVQTEYLSHTSKVPKTNVSEQKTDLPSEPKGWVVQVGTFTVEANAHALIKSLHSQHVSASLRVLQNRQGNPYYKVITGPHATRERAEEIQKKITSTTGTEGIILPHH